MGKGHKIPESTRKKVLDVVRAGIRYSDIARSFKIGQTSVRRIAAAAKINKSPETVSSPLETVSEDNTDSGSPADTNIITDVPENVKPDTLLNSVIDDAVLDRIEKLGFRIDKVMAERRALEIERNILIAYHEKYLEEQNNGT